MILPVSISFIVVLLCHDVFSDDVSTTGTISNEIQCTDASECIITPICALCLEGYSPGCDQAVCINGRCDKIRACSIYTSTQSTTTSDQCENDSQCPYPEYCEIECKPGLGPLCASAECIEGKCQTIKPCSRKAWCTESDVSQCAVPQICARCLDGSGPGCAQAACKDRECQIIQPCSIPSTTRPTTSPPQCRTDGECSFIKQCVDVCKDGLGPLCAYGKCTDGKCITIAPCSQKLRCTDNDVSQCIVRRLCALCLDGYGPGCTQAFCRDGECQIIQPCSIPPTFTPTTTSTTTRTRSPPQCRTDGECSFVKQCVDVCKDGLGPLCAYGKCTDGKCVTIAPCSQKLRCTDNDVSQCIVRPICALCLDGYGPGCTQAFCKDGECQIIQPCSIPPTTTPTTSPPQCRTDGECSFVKQCVDECKDGLGPLCAYGKCIDEKCVIFAPCSQKLRCTDDDVSQCIVPPICAECFDGYGPGCAEAACKDGECQIIQPCSQRPQCTKNDVSQCAVPKICGLCKEGYSPPCAQAVCENEKCRTIMPCTIYTSSTTTPPPTGTCTDDSQCTQISLCVSKCPAGTTPLCTIAKCLNGECTYIKPCTQRLCKTRTTCPYNKRRCGKCSRGYGPPCERPACVDGICSVISPCSRKLSDGIDTASVE